MRRVRWRLAFGMALVTTAAMPSACLVDFDGLDDARPAPSNEGSPPTDGARGQNASDGGDLPRFCEQKTKGTYAFCIDFEDPSRNLPDELVPLDGVDFATEVDPDDPTNRVLAIHYDASRSSPEVRLSRIVEGGEKAARSVVNMRFRVGGCSSDYAKFALLQYASATAQVGAGIAEYDRCNSVSVEDTMLGRGDAGRITVKGAWHRAAISLERDKAAGQIVTVVTVDGQPLATSRTPIESYSTARVVLGSFYASSNGKLDVFFDDIVAVITP